MKLALRLAVLAILVTVAALVWWRARGVPASEAATPAISATRSEQPATSEPDAPEPDTVAQAVEGAPIEREAVPTPTPTIWPPLTVTTAHTPLLKVRVISKERGEPIAGERVYLKPRNSREWSASWIDGSHATAGESPQTDTGGRAEFEAEAGIELQVWAENHGHETTDVAALAPQEVREITIALPTEADLTLFGRLVDGETGDALADGVVSFDSSPSSRVGAPDEIRAKSDGSFQLSVRSWEQPFANASADGYARIVFGLEPGHATREKALEVRLSRAATVEVAVHDGSRAVGDIRVELVTDGYRLHQATTGSNFYWSSEEPTWTGTTDAAGRAEIGELPPRVPLTLSLRAADRELRKEATPITLDPGERRRVDVYVGSGATILGRVEDGSGAAVAKCEIWRVPTEIPITADAAEVRRTGGPHERRRTRALSI